MKFFIMFCDNNLSVISTLDKTIKELIENMEHQMNVIQSAEDLKQVKKDLSSIIRLICATQRTDKPLLNFIGGLTMIRYNMKWENGKKHFTDINDSNQLK